MSSAVNFGGVISGLDTKAIIDAILNSEKIPQDRLRAKQADVDNRAKTFDSLAAKVRAFSTSLDPLNNTTGLATRKATNPTAGATIEVKDGAATGTHTLKVISLAARDTELSEDFASDTATGIGTGSIDITVAGTPYTITIGPGQDSLVGIRNAINGADIGVTATVINDGAGDPYRLLVYADNSGAANTVVIDDSGLSGGSGITFTQKVAAADSRVEIDGVEVYSPSNDITNFLSGVTIHLTETTTPKVYNFSVQPDVDTAYNRMKAIVDAYNDARSLAAKEVASGGGLAGETKARSVLSALRNALATSGQAGGIETISEIGMKSERDGSLKLDAAKFKKALEDREDEVITFVSDTQGLVKTLKDSVKSLIDPSSGELALRAAALRRQSTSLGREIDQWEKRLEKRRQELQDKFGRLETTMAKMRQQSDSLIALNRY